MKRNILIIICILLSLLTIGALINYNEIREYFSEEQPEVFYKLKSNMTVEDDLEKLSYDLNLLHNWNNYLKLEDLCDEQYSDEIAAMGNYMIESNEYFQSSNNEEVILEFEQVKSQFEAYSAVGDKLVLISQSLSEFDYSNAKILVDELISYIKENDEIFKN